jgi:hypothetical protein
MALADELVTGFDPPDYEGSAEGVEITGVEGWYIPATGGVTGYVFTYDGNTIEMPFLPDSCEQFYGGIYAGTFCRSQHDIDWSSGTEWEVIFDYSVGWRSEGDVVNNIGSFSLQPADDVASSYILLASWTDDLDPTVYRMGYLAYDSFGARMPNNPPTIFPDTEDPAESKWNNLKADHWYRHHVKLTFEENRITYVAIEDLETGELTEVFDPIDWTNGEPYYLGGGDTDDIIYPEAIRFFTGGGPDGNVTSADNLSITPGPPGDNPCAAAPCEGFLCGDSNGDGSIDFDDIDCFVQALISQEAWANCGTAYGEDGYVCANDINGDGSVDFNDIDGFVEALISGACP